MRRRGAIMLAGASMVAIACLITVAAIGGYRLNLTPSEPLGLWRIEALRRSAEIGDVVFVCPPATAMFEEARRRGYLRRGLCPGGFAPLIKTVAALPGQHVEVTDHVVIDRRSLAASVVRKTDGEGRPVTPYPGGIVPSGHLYLHSSFVSSYDSRYFGPVPDSGLLGLARPILTFDP
ncbi:conjugative transfer signal peptidase TraF [Ensifer aridi]|uniref:conjugative transfer signal peptidase TraF n=1 Tax=Ensifer aridi TaxID=1708715 RepID=UPI000A10A855|nr:conjugative transfer signal peptidase TraF [Ensifer aridi]